MFRLRGARVLITGASSGIGAATAVAFARRHARLALCARRLDRLQAIAEQCRHAGAQEVVVKRADVGRPDDARAFVGTALQELGQIDALVNNAAVGWRGPFVAMGDREVQELVQTNLLGYIWVTRAALPSMLEAESGVVVNVCSVVGLRAVPYGAVYSATKYAITGMSHALRGELSGTGVKISTVYPGTTSTDFQGRRAGGRFTQTPERVARTVVRAVRWPRRDVVAFPYRLAAFAEPFFGGLMDHAVGEVQRHQDQPPLPPREPPLGEERRGDEPPPRVR
ncbi:MAG: SDR family NAD(P)-dependent oxidoreductase [Candidatus Dormibacteraceae bacterium]